MDTIYFVDTSAWINLSRHYPEDIFPNLWGNIEELISEKRILAPKEVLDEIEHGHDELKEWCKKHRKMFQDADTSQVKKIIKDHPTLVDAYARHESADPYVIALAVSCMNDISGWVPIIVTDENVNRKSGIPYVARNKGVQSCKLTEMFQKEGWQF